MIQLTHFSMAASRDRGEAEGLDLVQGAVGVPEHRVQRPALAVAARQGVVHGSAPRRGTAPRGAAPAAGGGPGARDARTPIGSRVARAQDAKL